MILNKFNTKETNPHALKKIIDLGVGGVISLNCFGLFFFSARSVDGQKGEKTRRAATWICVLQKIHNLLAQNALLNLDFRAVFCNKLEYMKEVEKYDNCKFTLFIISWYNLTKMQIFRHYWIKYYKRL